MRTVFFKTLFLILLIFSSQLCLAKQLSQNTKLWTAVNFSGLFAKASRFGYMAALHGRFGINDGNFDQSLFRIGINYQLLANIRFWLGYDYSVTMNDTTQHENRIWQQLSWILLDKNQFQLLSRSKLEQRKNVDESEIAWRFRQRIILKFPGFSKAKIRPLIGDEVFFNLNNTDWTTHQTIAQNRVLVGLLIPLVKKVSLETDYINRYRIGSTKDTMDHIVFLSLNINPS